MEWLLPFVAVGAGVVSITSPCVLPLIPAYVSYMTALPASEVSTKRARPIVLRTSVAFVFGFTLVFVALGASVSVLGSVLLRNVPLLTRIAGAGIIVLGATMVGILRIPILDMERRVDLNRAAKGPRGAFPLGMAFAIGWVPCIGPVLATILATAAVSQTAAWGALLLALYSVGLGLPFIGIALGLNRFKGSVEWLRRHGRRIEQAGGVLLMAVGVAFLTGIWRSLFIPLQRTFAQFGWPPI